MISSAAFDRTDHLILRMDNHNQKTNTYTIDHLDGKAKAATFETVHGTVKTPVFMNVATVAAIKGAVSTEDLENIGTQVMLCNTYHLHVRPGDELVAKMGGLHKFTVWNKPILTDSGGFQVFSLADLRKIKEEGVFFNSHIDGRKIFMGPEESMQIQSHLASTIAMAFDECPSSKAERSYVEESVARTERWLERCKKEMERLNSLPETINKHQMLFGINQGACFDDIRIANAQKIAELDLPGYSIGGLAVGETHEEMYKVLEAVVPHLPEDKPTYLMGVGTPLNILEAVERGVDFFDCVYPTRNGRHGHVYTVFGKIYFIVDCVHTFFQKTQPLCVLAAKAVSFSQASGCVHHSVARNICSVRVSVQSVAHGSGCAGIPCQGRYLAVSGHFAFRYAFNGIVHCPLELSHSYYNSKP